MTVQVPLKVRIGWDGLSTPCGSAPARRTSATGSPCSCCRCWPSGSARRPAASRRSPPRSPSPGRSSACTLGWIVDRVDRRLLLSGVNLARALLLAGVSVAFFTDSLSLELLLGAAILLGAAETLVDTALTSTIPMVVEPEGRNRANARIEATINLTNQLAGPPLAGLLARGQPGAGDRPERPASTPWPSPASR